MNKLFGLHIRYYLIAALALILAACVDSFNPDLTDSQPENVLVVEGFITNESISHKVTLSRTKSLNSPNFSTGESGAIVQVVDLDNNLYELTEGEAGQYFTNESEFSPEVGQSYQLKIKLADGEEYQSDFQELLPVAPIDSIWYKQTSQDVIDEIFINEIDVLKLYTNYEAHDESKYYRYEYWGTYSVRAQYQGSPICWRDQDLVPDDFPVDLTCYINERVDLPLNISTYPDPITGKSDRTEIMSIPTDSRFMFGYSMVVKKFSVTKGYHDFLDQVRGQSEYGGSIFDPPPTQIIGNISNINDPEKFALGYFSTLAETTKRVFISNLVILQSDVLCFYDPSLQPPDDIPKYFSCCDCRMNAGAYTEQPEFWGN